MMTRVSKVTKKGMRHAEFYADRVGATSEALKGAVSRAEHGKGAFGKKTMRWLLGPGAKGAGRPTGGLIGNLNKLLKSAPK